MLDSQVKNLLSMDKTVPGLLTYAQVFLDRARQDYTSPKLYTNSNGRSAAAALTAIEFVNHIKVNVSFYGRLAQKHGLGCFDPTSDAEFMAFKNPNELPYENNKETLSFQSMSLQMACGVLSRYSSVPFFIEYPDGTRWDCRMVAIDVGLIVFNRVRKIKE